MDLNNFLQSKTFRMVFLCIAFFIMFILVFKFGVMVGTQKAEFSFMWAEAYHKNFSGPETGFFGNLVAEKFTNPNGCFGRIMQIMIFSKSYTNLVVEDAGGIEKVIIVSDQTVIRKQSKNISASGLQVNDDIVTIGSPNPDGTMNAELIRVMSLPFGDSTGKTHSCIVKIKKII